MPFCDAGCTPSEFCRFCLCYLLGAVRFYFIGLSGLIGRSVQAVTSLLPGCLYFRHYCRFFSDYVLSDFCGVCPPVILRDYLDFDLGEALRLLLLCGGVMFWFPSCGCGYFSILFLAFRIEMFSLRLLLLLCDGLPCSVLHFFWFRLFKLGAYHFRCYYSFGFTYPLLGQIVCAICCPRCGVVLWSGFSALYGPTGLGLSVAMLLCSFWVLFSRGAWAVPFVCEDAVDSFLVGLHLSVA